jgi:hypothetical protein
MRPPVVGVAEATQEWGEIVGSGPRLPGEPLLERAHEALGDPVRLGAVARDEDVEEAVLIGEVGNLSRREMRATVGNEELQLGGEEGTERLDDQGGCHLGAGNEEGQAQALAGAVVGEHQDSNPGRLVLLRRAAFPQALTLLAPDLVFGPPPLQGRPPLRP